MHQVCERADRARAEDGDCIGRGGQPSLSSVWDHPDHEQDERDAQVDEHLPAPAALERIGAALAVLVYEAALPVASSSGFEAAVREMGALMLYTLGVGALIGGVGALITVVILRRFWVPDFLQSPVLLMLVAGAFTASNLMLSESGLFTVTLMGVFLANQRLVPVKHIVEFKENLRVLLIASLFILLAADVRFGDVDSLAAMLHDIAARRDRLSLCD